MIRINLLGGKRKAKRSDAGQRQLGIMLGAVLLGVGGLAIWHISVSNTLEELNRSNGLLNADIERLKAELGDYDKVKAQREDLLKQRKTIEALESNRTGPVYLMRELSEILTPGKGPTFESASYQESLMRDPNAGFNPGWDTRLVWLESFDEDQRRVRIRGQAKSNEDVAEFLKRLQLSVFFKDVVAEGISQVTSGTAGTTVKYVTFGLTATVIY